ncbi:uncharacterized protein [Physcomitrium patens]|uniref:GTD-binding domain-containing protein n=1 Tax=Physcomitrium patens TaxID=3218 RepID=A0A7I4APU7_PHYPA|nr:uncharacterized protein LOC112291512 [Physcomitrium patens]XP_024394811.1 uncharacterized protein LOC112291512 [Physcomitrium patens]XP_024394812.1 uncharacterized protein LOC112291512 [Physcomitrium patens]XP_024394813.1 uncharacterized protein LOC112291512 [Physcomitrium patens]|eukprot:XP_024394810.1 uncharacterized protein LOC112291512 [Physcomitrella patens]
MAWGSLHNDAAFHWSATALLFASGEALLALIVFICAVLNFFTSSFIRVSGLYVPCSCCTHLQKGSLENVDSVPQKDFVLPKPKSISVPIESEVSSRDVGNSDDSLRDGDLKKSSDFIAVCASSESTAREHLREDSPEGEKAGSVETNVVRSVQINEDSNGRCPEDVRREQYLKDQELLHALQLEREAMAALYSELEEERNSSATAASEALAMISRLQEEKAAIQMESRQFQRMVMEKALYDQEAIEVLKEILAKREEERLALEEEMHLYKERLEAVLMEERDYAQRAGVDCASMLHLEESYVDEKSITSPKSERAELTTTDRVAPNSRLAKEEEAEFLDRLNKTKSQLLTALLREGISEPASAIMESVSFANEIHKAMAKVSPRTDSLPVLDHDSQKTPLGLIAIKAGRENSLPIPPPTVHKGQLEQAPTKTTDCERAADAPVSASSEIDPPSSPFTVVEKTEVVLEEDDKKVSDEPVSTSSERGLPASSFAAIKKQTDKTLGMDGEKPPGKPEFVSLLSLKRRWIARGSQEVSLAESLAKAKEDRRMEEKRLSVLEYVRNLEEQLQQQGGRPTVQHARPTSINGGEEGTKFKSPGQLESSSSSVMSGSLERGNSFQRLIMDEDSVDNTTFLQDERRDKKYAQQYSFNSESDAQVSNDDGEIYVNAGRSEESVDEALSVHDIYETIDSLRRENGEMKLIQEIAQQSRELRGLEQKEIQSMSFPPQTLQFQVGIGRDAPRTYKKRRHNSTVRADSCRPSARGPGLSHASSLSMLDLCTEGKNNNPYSVV